MRVILGANIDGYFYHQLLHIRLRMSDMGFEEPMMHV